jgi:hypothetical protein
MDPDRLSEHVKRLCVRNLKSGRVVVCAACPFEEIIVERHPELADMFDAKRKMLAEREEQE